MEKADKVEEYLTMVDKEKQISQDDPSSDIEEVKPPKLKMGSPKKSSTKKKSDEKDIPKPKKVVKLKPKNKVKKVTIASVVWDTLEKLSLEDKDLFRSAKEIYDKGLGSWPEPRNKNASPDKIEHAKIRKIKDSLLKLHREQKCERVKGEEKKEFIYRITI